VTERGSEKFQVNKIRLENMFYVKVGLIRTRIKQYWLIELLNNVQDLQQTRTLGVFVFLWQQMKNIFKIEELVK
jgi:hypothetical protein